MPVLFSLGLSHSLTETRRINYALERKCTSAYTYTRTCANTPAILRGRTLDFQWVPWRHCRDFKGHNYVHLCAAAPRFEDVLYAANYQPGSDRARSSIRYTYSRAIIYSTFETNRPDFGSHCPSGNNERFFVPAWTTVCSAHFGVFDQWPAFDRCLLCAVAWFVSRACTLNAFRAMLKPGVWLILPDHWCLLRDSWGMRSDVREIELNVLGFSSSWLTHRDVWW